MRIASYRADGGLTWGVLSGDRISDARSVDGAPASVAELLEWPDAGPWLEQVAQSSQRALSEVRLVAPLRPRQDLIALGLNYAPHLEEAGGPTRQSAAPKQPILFGKAASSVIGLGDDIKIPRMVTTQVDWEVELAVVIGRRGRDIARAETIAHVFGYTIANDVSARDLQFLDGGQWYRGKSLDTFCPLGPWIVTSDELGDARGLRLTLRVNGVTKQTGSTDEMIFKIPEVVASASRGRTLLPGDVILTGTPAGVGFTRKPPEYLRDGDLVEAEIDRIGVLRNRVSEV